MNTLIRWDLFKEMNEMQDRFGSLFNLPLFRHGDGKQETKTVAEWSPLVDIVEYDKEYLIKAELPEVRKENVKVTVENGVLSITGERNYEKDKKYHRVERAYGSFVRAFTVPDDADASKVTAEFKDGVLKVHLAKEEKAKPKAIEVKID